MLTYEPVGLSLLSPKGFNVHELRVKIGHGTEDFAKAQQAIDSWQALKVGWAEPHPAASRPEIGQDVAVIATHFGFWSLNACRVVGRFPASAQDSRYGFAYGTLSDHAECGEELFVVELDEPDGSVWYRVRAVSKPRSAIARAGAPVARLLQRRFQRDSAGAMAAAVRS